MKALSPFKDAARTERQVVLQNAPAETLARIECGGAAIPRLSLRRFARDTSKAREMGPFPPWTADVNAGVKMHQG